MVHRQFTLIATLVTFFAVHIEGEFSLSPDRPWIADTTHHYFKIRGNGKCIVVPSIDEHRLTILQRPCDRRVKFVQTWYVHDKGHSNVGPYYFESDLFPGNGNCLGRMDRGIAQVGCAQKTSDVGNPTLWDLNIDQLTRTGNLNFKSHNPPNLCLEGDPDNTHLIFPPCNDKSNMQIIDLRPVKESIGIEIDPELEPLSGRYAYLRIQASQKCLAPKDNQMADGTPIVQVDCVKGSPFHLWSKEFEEDQKRTFRYVLAAVGKCLTSKDVTSTGGNLILSICAPGEANQIFIDGIMKSNFVNGKERRVMRVYRSDIWDPNAPSFVTDSLNLTISVADANLNTNGAAVILTKYEGKDSQLLTTPEIDELI